MTLLYQLSYGPVENEAGRIRTCVKRFNVVPRGIRHESRVMSVPTTIGQTFLSYSAEAEPGFEPGTSRALARAGALSCSPCLHSARSRHC